MRSRAAELGGGLTISSAPQGGTVSGWKRDSEGRSTARESRDRIRVLLVDDHGVVRRGVRAFLDSELDFEVIGEADGGAPPLELLARFASAGRRPHAVVMDVQMEPLDGIESTRQIRLPVPRGRGGGVDLLRRG